MAGPVGEKQPPNRELPLGLRRGIRPSGLAGGFGFHPDTIAGPNPHDSTTPKTAHGQLNSAEIFRWGTLAMIRPFMNGELIPFSPGFKPFTRNSETQKPKDPLRLEARVNELLRQANNEKQRENSIPLYLAAAEEAAVIYDMPPTQGDVDSEGIRRALHGGTAVNAFINAGAINDALNLGRRMIKDRSIPPEFRDSVRKEIESLEKTLSQDESLE